MNLFSAFIANVRALGQQAREQRYAPVPPHSASASDDFGIDEADEDVDGVGESGRGGRPGRATQPLLYAEQQLDARPWRRRRRQTTAKGFARGDSDYEDGVLNSVWTGGSRRFLKLTLLVAGFGLMLYLGIVLSRAEPSCDTAEHGYQCYPTVAQYWGQYSPFFSVPSDVSAEASGHVSGDASALPSGCRFTFAQVLSRHGARDPTAGKSAAYAALMARILTSVDRRHLVDGPEGRFGFLARYHYRLGADELTRFGVRQMVHSGAHFFERYRGLIRPATATKAGPGDRLPFVRSADQHRVVMSAINWVRGFQAARQAGRGHGGTGEDEQQIVLLPEAAGFNNTLSYNGLCPAFSGRAGTAAQGAYAGAFVPPITARLNRGLPGAALADEDTISLMDLCPYETVADETAAGGGGGGGAGGQGGRRLAGFCHLFSEAEWRAYDYYQTLGKWYGYGDGSALGASQGVGFVNELIARLTQQPVADRTSTNRTLDADPATFPLNASVYADFSHDNDMANVFAALGLYNGSAAAGEAPLRPDNATRTEPGALRGYAASWTVPFAARMYVEKMVCGAEGGEEPAAAEEEEEEELVRILVNDRVVPLANCGADAQGRCRLGRFVESLAFARSGGRWDDCFA